MRKVHRLVALFAALFGLYVGSTGTFIQLIDLWTLFTHAPATDPNMKAIREGHDGPQNFQVILIPDYSAPVLPADLDFNATLAQVMRAARTVTADAPISYVELRMAAGKPVGRVASAGRLLSFDAGAGAALDSPDTAPKVALPPAGNQPSLRNTIKNIHRMTAYGDYATPIFALIALTMCAMLFTGLALYFQLLGARLRTRRTEFFWFAGGWWRSLHRATAIAAAVFLTVVILSGTVEAFGSVGVSYYRVTHGGRPGLTADVSSPLTDAQLPGMLQTTLAGFRADSPGQPIKALRLRVFAGMPQGIVISGEGEGTRQLAFNANTGKRASLSGANYPVTGQPFGWEADQFFKQMHRGDMFGMTGRWLNLVTGLSLLFLSVSGLVMYLSMWLRRRQAGRSGVFWA